MLTIDGSQGEGGGQILRTSLALALITGRALRIDRIRAGRPKSGLMRQHLAAVQAAARVGRAVVRGADLGSARLEFEPQGVSAGDYDFRVESAGSATLVVQTVLPALLTAGGPSTLHVTGGTHNPHAPPFEFLARAFLPQIARTGPRGEATLVRHGFYPAGGGELTVTIEPVRRLAQAEWLERGELRQVRAQAVVSALSPTIAERELAVFHAAFGPDSPGRIIRVEQPRGPGNVLTIECEFERITEVMTGFGQRGVPAEAVARAAVDQARRFIDSGAAVGPHLADQLLLPLALAGGGALRTSEITAHTRTNAEVIARFLDVRFEVATLPDGTGQVRAVCA